MSDCRGRRLVGCIWRAVAQNLRRRPAVVGLRSQRLDAARRPRRRPAVGQRRRASGHPLMTAADAIAPRLNTSTAVAPTTGRTPQSGGISAKSTGFYHRSHARPANHDMIDAPPEFTKSGVGLFDTSSQTRACSAAAKSSPIKPTSMRFWKKPTASTARHRFDLGVASPIIEDGLATAAWCAPPRR